MPHQSSWSWPKYFRWSWKINYWLIFTMFLIAAWLRTNPDFGWHIRAGQDLLTSWSLPAHDPYTYTASDFAWINHEWLTDLVQAFLYNLAGWPGLVLLHTVGWTWAVYVFGGKKQPQAIVLLAAIAVLPFVQVRSITWNLVLFALLFILTNRKVRYIWAVPLLFMAWANIHGSFMIGLVYLIYLLIKTRRWRLYVTLVVSSLLTTGITPYGFEIYTEIFRTLLDPSLRNNINEWRAGYFSSASYAYLLCWLLASLLTLISKQHKILRFDILLFLIACFSMRHTPLFVIYSLHFTMTQAEKLQKLKISFSKRSKPYKLLQITLVSLLTLTFAYSGYLLNSYRQSDNADKLIDQLKSQPCQGRLFNYYDIGGQLIWRLPEQKVYIDGRMPSWQHPDGKYIDDYLRIQKDDNFRAQQFEKHQIKCVVWPNNDSFTKKLLKTGWTADTSATGNDYTILRN